jgi:hypothetical protein
MSAEARPTVAVRGSGRVRDAGPIYPGVSGTSESKLRLPDFFIVGHPKSGTTALYEMLRAHPGIFMPELKEPEFFAADMARRFQPPRSGPLPQTLERYAALFEAAGSDRLAGEASVFYLCSRVAAAAIARERADARIVAVLREPASFLRSFHLQMLQAHVESERSLRRALSLEPERREGRRIPRRCYRPSALLYSDHVRYVEQLSRYEALFAPEQLLVLIYEDFRAENLVTLGRVLRFLGLDGSSPPPRREANPTVSVRSQQLEEVVHAVSVGRGPISRAAKASVKALVPRGARRRALRATRRRVVRGAPPAADECLMGELRHRFKGEVVALSEHLDRDLVSLWGYDRLG